MTEKQEMFHDQNLASLVGRYATPLAILLVSFGIFFSPPTKFFLCLSIGLLLLGMIFNLSYGRIIKHLDDKARGIMAKFRMGINVGINAVLIYILGNHWQPMWLLLALTPIATAIYSTRKHTIGMSLSVSVLLLLIHLTRGDNAPHAWGQQIAYVSFILLISLMINELAHLALKRGNGFQPPEQRIEK